VNDIEVQLVGNVVTAPELRLTKGGRSVTSFRLASAPRVPDGNGGWRDGETSFMNVTCWNATAENVVLSLKKGNRVLLFGTLKIAEWEKEGRKGREVEIDATHIGHDLQHGMSIYRKVAARSSSSGAAGDQDRDTTGDQDRTAAESPTASPAAFSPGVGDLDAPGVGVDDEPSAPDPEWDDHAEGGLDSEPTPEVGPLGFRAA